MPVIRNSFLLVIPLCVFLLLLLPLKDGFTDDGFIHIQYAKNIITLGEYSFNPGQVSFGTTSPLWVMIHALVGWITNTDMDWRRGDINQPMQFTEDADSDAKGAAINAAGLITQAIGGEVILRVDKIDKNDPFMRGMMAWNILNPILYAMDYWFFHKTNSNDGDSYRGDLAGVERYTSTPTAHGFALCMAGIAAFQANRFLQTQSWAPDWLKTKSHHVNFRPLPSGGMAATYSIPF